MHFQDALWGQLPPSNIFLSSHWRCLTCVYLGMLYLTSLLHRFYALKKQYPFTLRSEHVAAMYVIRGVEKLKFCSHTLQCRAFQLASSADSQNSHTDYAYCSRNSSSIKMWISKWVYNDYIDCKAQMCLSVFEGLFGMKKIYLGYALANIDCLPWREER